jgi:hypothetical protein
MLLKLSKLEVSLKSLQPVEWQQQGTYQKQIHIAQHLARQTTIHAAKSAFELL